MSTRIPTHSAEVRGAPQLRRLLPALPASGLGDRGLGRVITDHRSSWTRFVETDLGGYFVKTYDYPTLGARLRGALRNTGPWVRSRAAREYDAMHWMAAHQILTANPVGVLERRRFGLLERAVLITEALAATSVDALLADLNATERTELGTAIGRLVGRLHRAGFRDRNLDTRNLLARRDESGSWQVAKIDSPRYVLCRAVGVDDALARADWSRLLPQLTAFGIDADAVRAAAARA